MRIQRASRLITLAILLAACTSVFTRWHADQLIEQRRQAYVALYQSLQALDLLARGSDVLTEAVRAYAVTGDLQYAQEFQEELTQRRSREQAVQHLLALQTPPDEMVRVTLAKQRSDELARLERQIFTLRQSNRTAQALDLAFGASYQRGKAAVREPLEMARAQAEQRLLGRTAELSQQADVASLKSHPRFAAFLTEANIEMLYRSAPLHDIGKVGIPDHILLKPGKLTPEEFEVMKTHTTLGWQALEHAEQALESPVGFLQIAKQIALSHQEKWDGSGYPQGLAGDAIPIPARLMALADVYDALVKRRIYKPAFTHARALTLIEAGSGQHFDPDVVQAFLQIHERFHAIATEFADADEDLLRKEAALATFIAPVPPAAS